MIEIFYISLSIIIFPILFSYPLNIFNYKIFFSSSKFTFFDLVLFNIVIHLIVLLSFSFFLKDFFIIFVIDIILSLVFLFYYLKNYLVFLKKNLYLFIFYSILSFSFFVSIAFYPILSWDGAVHWVYKALNYYQGETYENLKNVPMNYYPHLGGFMWFYFWKNSLLQLEYFGRFFFSFIFLITIFSLFEYLNERFKLPEKIILILIFSYLCKDNFLFGGYQEYFVFFLLYVFSRFFLFSKNSKNNLDKNILSFFLLCTSFLILWTKQEGFFYFFILNIIFLLHSDSLARFKIFYFLLCALLISIFVLIKIYYFGQLNFNEDILRKELLNSFYPTVLVQKFLLISKYIIISFIKYPIWIVIIASVIILYKKNYFKKNRFYLTYVFLNFSLLYLIYFQTKMNIEELLPLTLSRLIFQSSGFLLPITLECINRFKNQKISN
jgi:hypothetical protein